MKKSIYIVMFLALSVRAVTGAWGMECPELVVAAKSGKTEKIKKLLSDGCDLNSREDAKPWHTALMQAALENRYDTVRLLLKKGANVNKKGAEGKTALFLSVASTWPDRIERLEKEKDFDKERFMQKENDKNLLIIDMLIGKGADVNHKVGITPLILAVMIGRIDHARVLIEMGADVNAAREGGSNDGFTPLMYAMINNRADIVKLLAMSGANVNARIYANSTPLKWAKKKGYDDIVTILKRAGARE